VSPQTLKPVGLRNRISLVVLRSSNMVGLVLHPER
jgi:hypothetical protein